MPRRKKAPAHKGPWQEHPKLEGLHPWSDEQLNALMDVWDFHDMMEVIGLRLIKTMQVKLKEET